MKELILKENNPKNYIVVNLDNGISFIHDNKTGKNYFNNKIIAQCTGVDEITVRRHWSNFKELNNNVQDMNVNLKVLNIKKPVVFKSFDFLTYVAYRSNQPEAVRMRNYIVNAIDEKFNRDVGFERFESLEQEALETIQYLKNKEWEETAKAFETTNKKEIIYHRDLADKYLMDITKRTFQLRNELNCRKRLKRELKLNQEGYLTESTDKQVFIPGNQMILDEFKE